MSKPALEQLTVMPCSSPVSLELLIRSTVFLYNPALHFEMILVFLQLCFSCCHSLQPTFHLTNSAILSYCNVACQDIVTKQLLKFCSPSTRCGDQCIVKHPHLTQLLLQLLTALSFQTQLFPCLLHAIFSISQHPVHLFTPHLGCS